ncbi:hypothetical protein FOA43_002656 [Brettanomyces nanus]|uniref:beta-glucosidase n=1 Tax=Eeniella nana TaxID=13502 RepID=A0A875S4L3_EENNA|nr:uncharacterized protein FOA43_002656 [Brettanomyces nanus]QPG75305.1 hypothetical protein FOA43_002656 [Brettanomyces nanus]
MSVQFSVEEVWDQLSTDDKIKFLSLDDTWHIHSIERLHIPAIRLSDGPNGVRGSKFFRGTPSACLPCGTGLGSTWDKELLQRAGKLMAEEAKHKGAHVILGPTVNIQRAPIGGRGFESFGEDPYLSGWCAASVIKGIQSKEISATIKHFVCNDMEDDRTSFSALVTERALREVYLMPFQLAIKYANPWSIMTSYNKVNGTHVSENKFLLTDILRDEWHYNGLLMSDWFGVYSSENSINAGLDLECPGPAVSRKFDSIKHQITSRELKLSAIDKRAKHVLKFIENAQHCSVSKNGKEDTLNNTPETQKLLREITQSGIVLLKNDDSILPLAKNDDIVIIGPNAKSARTSGGGSASLTPYYETNVYDSICHLLGEKKTYALGCSIDKGAGDLGKNVVSGSHKGFDIRVFKEPPETANRTLIEQFYIESSMLKLFDYQPVEDSELFYMDMDGEFTPETSGEYTISEKCFGSALVYLDGKILIDDKTDQVLGGDADEVTSVGYKKKVQFKAGQTYKFHLEFGSAPTFPFQSEDLTSMNGGGSIYVGLMLDYDEERFIADAVAKASKANTVILCTGSSKQYESEGFDRKNMDLPGLQDRLVQEILKVNSRVILVNQSGTPVTLPWIEKVPAFVQAWFGGCESGNAIADIIYGLANPSGKLSLTYPKKLEDNPAFLTYKSNNGEVVYGEDVFVGYRAYEKTRREPAFPFGFGLSYTSFKFTDLKVALAGDDLHITVKVTNTGARAGSEVVQVYVAPQTEVSVERPVKELKGFDKVHLQPSESASVTVTIPYLYASSYYNVDENSWCAQKGDYNVLVGDSSQGPFVEENYTLSTTKNWSGI